MRIRVTKSNIDRSMIEFLMKRPLSADMAAQLEFTPNLALANPILRSPVKETEQQCPR